MKTEIVILLSTITTIGLNCIGAAPAVMNIMDGYNLKTSYELILVHISLVILSIVICYMAFSIRNNK